MAIRASKLFGSDFALGSFSGPVTIVLEPLNFRQTGTWLGVQFVCKTISPGHANVYSFNAPVLSPVK